ncbi:hypothetical protein Q3G72_030849 [Acer saccharum]|nr:hypothetical protein Q3G72_030849 [Acer saccharum]
MSVLYNVDEQTVRSLNGCRVADQILKHVPNVEVDMVAVDADDLLAWKGWVESRFRQLTLKIVRVGDLCRVVSNEHAADLDSLVENGCLNASGVYQNGLSEGLEPSPALGTVVKSQDGARLSLQTTA